MARLPRLDCAGEVHYLIQRAHGALTAGVFVDDVDRAGFLAALREAAPPLGIQLHAYALLPDELQILATPAEAGALGRLMQALGRRYVSAYNRRHQHRGSLWDGRFRCAVLEPGEVVLSALRLVDGLSYTSGFTSAGHRTGLVRDPTISDPPEFWSLGNTPFEREAAYRELLEAGLEPPRAQTLRQAALGGWVLGSAEFVAEVGASLARAVQPRPRGRPRRAAGH